MADQEIDIEGIQRALDEIQEKFGISDKALSNFTKAVSKTSADFKKELANLNREVAKGKKGYEDQLGLLKKLDAAIDDLTDSMEDEQDTTKKLAAEQTKAALLAQRDALQTSASMKGLQEVTAKTTTTMGLAAVKGAGDFIKGLQANASSTELSTGLMNATIDVTTSGIKGLGQGAQAVAPMLMLLGPYGRVAGIALEFLGIAASASADTMNKLAKFGVEILQKEVEKTVKSFHEMNSAGAMFTNGMNDMRFYSSRAGLTVDQFSSAVKNTAPLLAEAGYTVSDGAKIVANVTSQFAKTTGRSGLSLQREMQNLGFGFQEQAELSAEIISDLRKTGGKATNREVAEATLDLAKNMRIVADITGQDAKQRMDQAKKQAEQYAFFSKVNEIARRTNDPGLPSRVKASLALMDETQRRAAIQATVLEGAVTDVGANLTGAADGGRVFADSLNRGGAQVVDMVGGFAQQGDQYLKATDEVGRAVSMSAIATGKNADLAAAFDSQGQQSLKLNSENLKKSIDQADKSSGAVGGFQDSLMAAEQTAQQLKIKMQEMMDVPIKEFAQVSRAMLEGVQNLINDVFGKNYSPEDAKRLKQANQMSKVTGQDLGVDDDTKIKRSKEREWMKQNNVSPRSLEGINYEQTGGAMKPKGMPMYAEGGTIPAGETGIVGEAGPEFVKGPAEVTSAKDTKEIMSKLGNTSVGQLTSQAMSKMQWITSEEEGSIAGYFLRAANELKWMGDKDSGVWTIGGEVVDQNTAREILDFARGWPKLKQEIQGEIDKARDMIGQDGSKLDAAIKESGGSTKMSDYATGYAKGGIASGSLSGYQATLHGTEAVVPLPDNKSIPVSLDGSALSGALQAQSDILSSILSAMQQNNKYASGLLQNSY